MTPTSTATALLEKAADRTRRICDADWCAVGFVDPQTEGVRVTVWATSPPDLGDVLAREAADPVLERTLRAARPHRGARPGGPFGSPDPRVAATRAALVLPVVVEGRLHGLVCIGRRSAAGFGERDETVLTWLADQSAAVCEHADMLAEAQRRRDEAEELAQLGKVVSQSLDSGEVAGRIVDGMRRLLGALTCVVYGARPAEAGLEPRAASGADGGRIPGHPPRIGAIGRALERRRTVRTADVLSDPTIPIDRELADYVRRTNLGAVLAVPLVAGDRTIGVLAVRAPTGREWTADEARLAEMFADHAVIALENARRFEESLQSAHPPAQVTEAALVRERIRIANELHDTLSQLAFSVGLKLNWCLHRVRRQSPLRSKLEDSRRNVGQMMTQIRHLIGHVAAGQAEELTFAGRLEQLGRDFRELTGTTLTVALDGDSGQLPTEVQDTIEKVLLEALVNAAKYAQATRVDVRVAIGADRATFDVADDGVGMPETLAGAGPPGHFGLRQMRERLEALGGRLEIQSRPGAGVCLRGALPLSAARGQRLKSPAPPVDVPLAPRSA